MSYAYNPSIIGTDGKFVIKNCIAAAIFKLNNFLKEHSCPTLQDRNSEIINGIVISAFYNARILDLKLRFFDSLMSILDELILEKRFSSSEYINNSLRNFCLYIKSMVNLINAILIRNSTVVDLMDVGDLNQEEVLDSWLKSKKIESKGWV